MNAPSIKVVAAKRRINKEKSWLDQVSVRHDDPDAVLDDDGNTLPLSELLTVPGVSFVFNNEMISVDSITKAFKIIANCKATIARLTGR